MSDAPTTDARKSAPAALRNRAPILDALRSRLPETGTVLEVASGTGEHIVHFARALPRLTFRPSDPDPENRASIAAWIAAEKPANVKPPLDLDVCASKWPVATADAILCANMIHIAPWRAAEGLIAGAARTLFPGGILHIYGPFMREGRHTAPSNAEFDASLKARNAEWGVRDLDAVEALARRAGFGAPDVVAQPANNLSVFFRLG